VIDVMMGDSVDDEIVVFLVFLFLV